MTDFKDGDIIITEHFAVRVTMTGRNRFAGVSDCRHPMDGAYVLGDKWFVVPALVEKVGREAEVSM